MGDARDVVRVVADNVRELRQAAGMTLVDLAERSGLGRSTLAQLEGGEANPSIETLWAIAAALGVPFGRLVQPQQPDVRVVRCGGGVAVSSDAGDWLSRLVSASDGRGSFEVYVFEGEVGTVRTAEPHGASAREHVLILRGRMRLGPTGAEVDAGEGDLVTFPADVAHTYEALEPGSRAVLIMEYR